MMRRRDALTALGLLPLAGSAMPQSDLLRPPPGASSLPKGLGRPIDADYFGAHLHRWVLQPGERAVPTRWPDGLAGSLRMWDSGTRWGDIAPSPGVWSFERMDAYVDGAQAHQAAVLYTLGSTPRWASARPDEPGPYGPGCAAEPVRMAHWEEYVTRVAQRYRGRIQAYELWNEPQFSDYALDRQYPGFFTGSVAQMVALAHAARAVLDRVDPAAVLSTPGFVNGPHRLERFLRSGGASHVQAVAYHFYASDSVQFMQEVAAVRAVSQRAGVSSLPLWNTESGVETHGEGERLPEGIKRRLNEAEAAAMTAQLLVLGAALQLQKFYYYAWDNDRSGMVDRGGAKTLRFAAMQRVQQWLVGARLSPPTMDAASVVQVRGMRDKRHFLLAWSADGKPRPMPVPEGWKLVSTESLTGDVDAVATVAGAAQRVTVSAMPICMSLASGVGA